MYMENSTQIMSLDHVMKEFRGYIYICNPDNCIALGTFLTLQRKLSLRALPYLSRSLDLGKNRQQKVCWVKK